MDKNEDRIAERGKKLATVQFIGSGSHEGREAKQHIQMSKSVWILWSTPFGYAHLTVWKWTVNIYFRLFSFFFRSLYLCGFEGTNNPAGAVPGESMRRAILSPKLQCYNYAPWHSVLLSMSVFHVEHMYEAGEIGVRRAYKASPARVGRLAGTRLPPLASRWYNPDSLPEF